MEVEYALLNQTVFFFFGISKNSYIGRGKLSSSKRTELELIHVTASPLTSS